jgi:FtsZ-interacting cell division protein ZipA
MKARPKTNLKRNAKTMNTKKILIVLGAVVLSVLLFIAGFYARGKYESQQEKQATSVAKTFVSDLVSNKTSEAYKLTASSLQKKQNQAAFTTAMANLKADKPTYQTAQVMRQGDQVFYIQQVGGLPPSASGSTTGNFYLALTKDGGKWKVSTVTIN